jgi:hypothetical protein
MSLPTGRSDRRIPVEVAVELARPDASQLEETAIAQNVSAHGMRVATEHVWHPGDPVLLGSAEYLYSSLCPRRESAARLLTTISVMSTGYYRS